MTESPRDELVAKNLPWIAVAVVALGVTVVRVRFGWPAVLLWLAFCALSGGILLFWESVRSALDPDSAGDDNDADLRALAQSELEERKRAALRALKDIRDEHALGKLSDEDLRALEARYRGEARAVLRSLDELLGEHLARAEDEFDRIADEAKAGSSPDAAPSPDAPTPDASTERAPDGPTRPDDRGAPKPAADAAKSAACPSCKTANDPDARFCKRCGSQLESAAS